VVIEGKNSVSLKNCAVTGRMLKNNVKNLQNVMIYQCISGDADVGKSSFSMEGGSLTSQNGDMFYVTNTSCVVRLRGIALKPSNDCLLKVVGNDDAPDGARSARTAARAISSPRARRWPARSRSTGFRR
jgi:hypothetical protein